MSADKHIEAFKQRHLKPGEEILASGEGYIGEMMGQGKNRQHNGILIVSAERVIFYRKGLLGEVIEAIQLKSITSIERKSLLGHYTVRFHTSHDALEFKTFKKPEEEALIRAVEASRSASATGPTQGGGPLEALKQLATLREAGIVTESEFAAKKSELLARL